MAENCENGRGQSDETGKRLTTTMTVAVDDGTSGDGLGITAPAADIGEQKRKMKKWIYGI